MSGTTRTTRSVRHRAGLTLVELLLAVAITALIGGAISIVMTAAGQNLTRVSEVRSALQRAHATHARLRAYTDASFCILEEDSAQGVAVWLHDERTGGTINLSELRILWFNSKDEELVIELANRTFTGVGDVLVDPATGRPVVFSNDPNNDGIDDSDEFMLTPIEFERWYRFRTYGDGLPGNIIRLLPAAYENRELLLDGPAGFQFFPGIIVDTSSLLVGGPREQEAALEFNLTRVLDAYEDVEAIDQIKLALNALVEFEPFEDVDELTVIGDTVYFRGDRLGRDDLWKSDLTAAGTMTVLNLAPGDPDSNPKNLTVIGDKLFFSADDQDNGEFHLWVSDGTDAGTFRVDDSAVGGFLVTELLFLVLEGRDVASDRGEADELAGGIELGEIGRAHV